MASSSYQDRVSKINSTKLGNTLLTYSKNNNYPLLLKEALEFAYASRCAAVDKLKHKITDLTNRKTQIEVKYTALNWDELQSLEATMLELDASYKSAAEVNDALERELERLYYNIEMVNAKNVELNDSIVVLGNKNVSLTDSYKSILENYTRNKATAAEILEIVARNEEKLDLQKKEFSDEVHKYTCVACKAFTDSRTPCCNEKVCKSCARQNADATICPWCSAFCWDVVALNTNEYIIKDT